MSAWRWLQRMCLEHHADSFEAEGYDTAQKCQSLTDKDKLQKLGVRDAWEQRVLLAVVQMQDEDEWITVSFRCPDRNHARRLFLRAFPPPSMGGDNGSNGGGDNGGG